MTLMCIISGLVRTSGPGKLHTGFRFAEDRVYGTSGWTELITFNVRRDNKIMKKYVYGVVIGAVVGCLVGFVVKCAGST